VCQNNLKQIGLALHNHHDTLGSFPASRTSGSEISIHAYLLPYIEQDPLYRSIDFNSHWDTPVNALATGTQVKTYLCPADPVFNTPLGWAGTNYRANEGTSPVYSYSASDHSHVNVGLPPPDGGFFLDTPHKIADILDGTSTTAAFSEHCKGDFSNAVSTPRADTYRPGTHPNSADQALAQCNAIDLSNLAFQGNSNVGAPWIASSHSITSYWHIAPPNGRSCMFPPQRIMTTATSGHRKGVNVLFFDGSVHFISNGIDLVTWRAIGTRDGREYIPSDY
jgi:prepilin-type processing-associated H-X9-DG protein